MKINNFFKKLFPCMRKNDSQSQPVNPAHLQEQLNNERQKKLEEIRLAELQEQARKDAEDLREKQEFERVLKEVEERKEKERRAAEERKQKEEFEQLLKEVEERARLEREQEQAQKEAEEKERIEAEKQQQQLDIIEEEDEHEHFGKEEMIHCVFLHYAEKYEEFYSTRPTPIHSNFNEKMFKDLCATFTFNTQDELEKCLHDYNLMRQQDRQAYRHLSKKRQLKCDLFKFYLFI